MTDLTYTDYCARCGRVEEVTPQPIEGGLLWRCGACDAVVDVAGGYEDWRTRFVDAAATK